MSAYPYLISVEKRILLHLLEFNTPKYEFEVPDTLTQAGIAEAVDANKSYVSVPINNYVKEGKIKECTGRVNHRKRKQKYYILTKKGKKFTKKIRSELFNIEITVKESDDIITVKPLKEITNYLNGQKVYSNVSELNIYSSIAKDCTLDLNCLQDKNTEKYIDQSDEAPVIQNFYGRENELSILKKWIKEKKEPNVIYIYGMAGIGKTTLAAKFIGSYRQEKHLFWHKIHELDTLRNILFKLAKFLSELGYNDLEMNLRTHKTIDILGIIEILKEDLENIPAILIFDDFQKSPEIIKDFFWDFVEIYKNSPETKMIILSRAMQFYSKKTGNNRKNLCELELNGLDLESTHTWLEKNGINNKRIKEIHKLSNGNPFFLESMVNLEGYINDEMYFELSDEERDLLGFLSILRFSIPKNCLINRDENYSKYLPLLVNKSIVKKDAKNQYFIHDIIRQFFYQKLSTSLKLANHLYVGAWFEENEGPFNFLEAVYHYQEAGEYEKAAQSAVEKSQSIFEEGLAGEFLNVLNRFDETTMQTDLWAEILILKGKAYYMGGEWKKGLLHFNFSSDFASLFGYKEIESRALWESGHVLEEQNLIEKAQDCFEKSLEISKSIDFPLGIGKAYRGLGRVFWLKEEYENALINFNKSKEIASKYNLVNLLISIHTDIGNVHDEMFETEKAIKAYNKSLELLKKNKISYELIRSYYNLAIAYRNRNEFYKAIDYYNKQMDLAEKYGDIKLKGFGYAGIGLCYAKINEIDSARRYSIKAEEIARYCENKNILFVVNWTKGLICKHEKRWEDGIEHLSQCLDILNQNKASFRTTDIHYGLGIMYQKNKDDTKANKHFKIAKQLHKDLGINKVPSF
jgi:tetratricopeptide (TPR) repeat protein